MRAILSEKNVVIVLFVLVLVAFSFAHEDSKKMEQVFAGAGHYFNDSKTLLTENKLQQSNTPQPPVGVYDFSR